IGHKIIMKKYSLEQKLKRLNALPREIKNVVGSTELSESLKSITKKYNLHIDQAGILGDEINFTLLGFTKTTDFIKNLKAQLNLPDEKVNAIAKDVNEKIFLPIRQSLKKAGDVSPAESGIRNQESRKPQPQKEIHHPSLNEKPHLETKFPSEGEARPLSESEEIKKQVVEQQAVKPSVAPPPNLPTGAPAGAPVEPLAEPKEPNLEALPPSEEKKPTHVDPYREPIE
ncbi:MAG: hypothetical protein ACE5H1_10760, partial [Thermodesulfobacteriota bacterium]